MNKRVYRYIGRDEDAPPIKLGDLSVVAGQIVDDPSLDGDARFMAVLNPAWVAPAEAPAPIAEVKPAAEAPAAVVEPATPDQPPAKESSP